MIFNKEKIKIVVNPLEECLDFISKHSEMLLPVEIHNNIQFQIRFKKEEYESLDNKTKQILFDYSNRKDNDFPSFEKNVFDLYTKTRFWSPCNSYIFDYELKHSLILKTQCKYGIEGLDTSIDYTFLKSDELPLIILINAEKNEIDKWIPEKKSENKTGW